jgi:hypothetical protein
VPQVRQVFAELLSDRPPTPSEIATKVSEVLRRSEEARIYHWYQRAQQFPPRRRSPPGQAGAPKKKRGA